MAEMNFSPGVINSRCSLVEVLTRETDYPIVGNLPLPAQSKPQKPGCTRCLGRNCGRYIDTGSLLWTSRGFKRNHCPLFHKMQDNTWALLQNLVHWYGTSIPRMRTIVQPIFHGLLIPMPGPPLSHTSQNQGYELYPWCPICLTQFHAADAIPHLRSYAHEMVVKACPREIRLKSNIALVCILQSLGVNLAVEVELP